MLESRCGFSQLGINTKEEEGYQLLKLKEIPFSIILLLHFKHCKKYVRLFNMERINSREREWVIDLFLFLFVACGEYILAC